MRSLAILTAALVASTNSLAIDRRQERSPLYTVEIAPGVLKVVTEAEKWALKAVSVTSHRYLTQPPNPLTTDT